MKRAFTKQDVSFAWIAIYLVIGWMATDSFTGGAWVCLGDVDLRVWEQFS